jgi:hypothetical protein
MPFRDSARAFVIAALQHIAANDGFTRTETDTWIRSGETFTRQTWNRLIYRYEVALQTLDLPEFHAFIGALRQDQVLRQFLGRYVGTSDGSGIVLHYERLLNGLLPVDTNPLAPRDVLDFDEPSLSHFLDALVQFRDTTNIPFIQLRPLIGLVCTGTVAVEPGLTIEPMSDGEIIAALGWGVLPTHMNQHRQFMLEAGLTHALKRRYSAPRVVLMSHPMPSLGSPPDTDRPDYTSDGSDLAHTLSIFAKGRVYVGPTFQYSTMGWPYSIGGILQPTAFSDYRDASRDMLLPANAEADIQAIWNALRTSTAAYRLAARRFYQGHVRDLVEDFVLDDMISAEALFLPRHATRKSHTLALNAAYYLGENIQPERQRIYDLFRDAYRVRSAIVHGEQPDPAHMRVNGRTITFIDFEDAIETELRRAFRKMIDHGQTGNPMNWAQIVLGSTPS